MGAQFTTESVPVSGPMTQVIVLTPDTTLPTIILAIENDGPGNVTDVRIDMRPVIVTGSRNSSSHNLFSGTLLDGEGEGQTSNDYAVDPSTGLQLCPDLRRTSKNWPKVPAGGAEFCIFVHYSPTELIIGVSTDGPAEIWAFART